MSKLKIFISSRNNDRIIVDDQNIQTLSEVRLWIKEKIEQEKLVGNEMFDVRINESFNHDTTLDSYNACLEEVKESDFVIVLYNGSAGWAPEGIEMGICHAEFATAIERSTKKTVIIDIGKFCPSEASEANLLRMNTLFNDDIQNLNRFSNPLKIRGENTLDNFKNSLLKEVKKTIHRHLIDRIKLANIYYDLSGNTRTVLDWKKLKYSDRNNHIKDILTQLVLNSENFKDTLNISNTIPDNMSVEDAKSFTGRPFLGDQDYVSKTSNSSLGPIHFIAVYGNATEIQVKNLIGYPDVSVIKDEFGIYVWEQNSHIQMVFLTNCKTQNAIKSNFLLFNNWAVSSRELEKIKVRAKARYHILKAINEAKDIIEENGNLAK